jgi:hypothetical protein
MLEDIIVIDNAIPVDYQNYLERNILEGDLNWKYRPNLGNDTAKSNINESNPAPGMIHVFCNERGIQSNLYYKILPMISIACQKANYNLSGIYGGRTFIQFPGNNNTFYTKIHTDLDIEHLVLLYYVIDADGDTVIFDKTTYDTPKNKLDTSDLTVLKKITPKKGTVVIFDGSRYHATTLPILGKRCIVNINLK